VATRSAGRLRLAAEARRTPVVPNGALGMLVFVAAEAMLFAGLISAFHIIRASALVWPPPDQPRLPVQQTLVNTAALLASGVALALAQRAFRRDWRRAQPPLAAAIVLGVFFVGAQGVEWLGLIRQGLTMTSSSLGSFFFLIVGLHGAHAVAALGALAYTWWLLQRGWRAQSQLAAAAVFWYFVVGLWPILYGVVYL
jgi:heme/copper-type cytochrome/quinol oxidase subunit 3